MKYFIDDFKLLSNRLRPKKVEEICCENIFLN